MLVIYGHERCGYCRKAKKLAEQYQIQFEYKDTDIDENLNTLKKELSHLERLTVPQIWWHGKHIGGYDDFAEEVENTRGFAQEPF